MKISSKGRYAVAAMMDLALHESMRPLTIADIAEKQRISLSYLEQIFADLRRAGLVKGTRGPGGGYRLAKPASDISIAQIIQALDEKYPNKGSEDYLPYELWSGLSKRLYQFLDTISLSECVDEKSLESLGLGLNQKQG